MDGGQRGVDVAMANQSCGSDDLQRYLKPINFHVNVQVTREFMIGSVELTDSLDRTSIV